MALQTEGRRLALWRRSPPSVRSLVDWLVQPAFVAHYRMSTHRLTTHQRGVTSFYCTATLPSVDRALHSSAEAMPLAALGPQLDQPRAATIRSGPPASLSHTSNRYIFARGRPAKHREPLLCTAASTPVLHNATHGTSSAGLIQHDHGICC